MLLLPLSSIARNNGQNYSSSQMGKAQNFSRISLMFLPLPALIHKAHPDQPGNLGAEVCSHQVPSLYRKHSFVSQFIKFKKSKDEQMEYWEINC